MRLQLSHTHAFPGCLVRIADYDNEDENLVEFGDGMIAADRYMREGASLTLTIAAYRTARGTDLGEKSWTLIPGGNKRRPEDQRQSAPNLKGLMSIRRSTASYSLKPNANESCAV